MSPPITSEAVRRAPKVVLHDHLDGGLRPATIVELADEVGYRDLPTTDLGELQAWFTRGADTGDILQYLATFAHTVGVMQTPKALERVAAEAALDLAADGVVYAEVRFAPELHTERGLSLHEVVEAVEAGFRRGSTEARSGAGAGAGAEATGRGITIGMILCAMRTGPRSTEIAQLAVDRSDGLVVGFDLAGAETGYPPSQHLEAVRLATAACLHVTIHASEPPGLDLIADALRCGAERIGHGVRLAEDITTGPERPAEASGPEPGPERPDDASGSEHGAEGAERRSRSGGESGEVGAGGSGRRSRSGGRSGQPGTDGRPRLGRLASYVRDRQIPLELCPTCNVQIGAVPSLAEHPLGLLHRLGFRVTVNTDNRLMSGVTVSSELTAAADAFGFDWWDLRDLSVGAMQSAFWPWDDRQRLIADISDGWAAISAAPAAPAAPAVGRSDGRADGRAEGREER